MIKELLKLYDFVKTGDHHQDYQLVTSSKIDALQMGGVGAGFARVQKVHLAGVLHGKRGVVPAGRGLGARAGSQECDSHLCLPSRSG